MAISRESSGSIPAVNYPNQIDNIPKYDINPFGLNTLVQSCDNLTNTFYHGDIELLNTFVYQAILSILVGKTQMLVGSRMEIRN